MQKYKCHKVVEAFKVSMVKNAGEGMYHLEGEGESVVVTTKWYNEHASGHRGYWPGYFVVYADGYTSWSPAKVFEEGYTKQT